MTTDNDKILREKKPNSSIAGASVLLGVSPRVIEACLPMLQYINGLDDEKFEIWKEHGYRTEKRNAQGKKTL
jgi:hypothetical protein